jgi:hypothetical protein
MLLSSFVSALPFLLDPPYGLTFCAYNPISDFVSAVAFNSFGFGTSFLPPLGWT